MTTVAEFVLAVDAEPWRAVGFDIDDVGAMQLGGIRLRFVGHGSGRCAIDSWVLADAVDVAGNNIDGLCTLHREAPVAPNAPAVHPNGVIGIDHVVVYTPDLERTCHALDAATAAPLKRVREIGQLRQGFHRLGELIVEVVSFPEVPVDHATFWGLALNVHDIDALFATLGDGVLSKPKDAVQPGRRIASFRESAALGVPVAVMSTSSR